MRCESTTNIACDADVRATASITPKQVNESLEAVAHATASSKLVAIRRGGNTGEIGRAPTTGGKDCNFYPLAEVQNVQPSTRSRLAGRWARSPSVVGETARLPARLRVSAARRIPRLASARSLRVTAGLPAVAQPKEWQAEVERTLASPPGFEPGFWP
jgi:hypothetical protein